MAAMSRNIATKMRTTAKAAERTGWLSAYSDSVSSANITAPPTAQRSM